MASVVERIREVLTTFAEDCKDFYLLPNVTEVGEAPTPLGFYRDFVSLNRPLIIRGGISHWPSVGKWTPRYLREKAGHSEVTVAVTPDGYADAVKDGLFVMPEERRMSFSHFLDIMSGEVCPRGIFYIQKQNSNFFDEFGCLQDDSEADITWATAAFGRQPDAVNFWMGDARAVTSMHRDHYENIYCVVSGQKDFILLPPTDLPWVPYEKFRTATYHENTRTGCFDTVPGDDTVPWIPLDAENPDLEKYPDYSRTSPVRCTLTAGDVLYLPSLWFHHVRQSHSCIAINFWYDMEFDIRYCYYKLLESIKDLQCSVSSRQ